MKIFRGFEEARGIRNPPSCSTRKSMVMYIWLMQEPLKDFLMQKKRLPSSFTERDAFSKALF